MLKTLSNIGWIAGLPDKKNANYLRRALTTTWSAAKGW